MDKLKKLSFLLVDELNKPEESAFFKEQKEALIDMLEGILSEKKPDIVQEKKSHFVRLRDDEPQNDFSGNQAYSADGYRELKPVVFEVLEAVNGLKVEGYLHQVQKAGAEMPGGSDQSDEYYSMMREKLGLSCNEAVDAYFQGLSAGIDPVIQSDINAMIGFSRSKGWDVQDRQPIYSDDQLSEIVNRALYEDPGLNVREACRKVIDEYRLAENYRNDPDGFTENAIKQRFRRWRERIAKEQVLPLEGKLGTEAAVIRVADEMKIRVDLLKEVYQEK